MMSYGHNVTARGNAGMVIAMIPFSLFIIASVIAVIRCSYIYTPQPERPHHRPARRPLTQTGSPPTLSSTQIAEAKYDRLAI